MVSIPSNTPKVAHDRIINPIMFYIIFYLPLKCPNIHLKEILRPIFGKKLKIIVNELMIMPIISDMKQYLIYILIHIK
jgi:hypothetical protein